MRYKGSNHNRMLKQKSLSQIQKQNHKFSLRFSSHSHTLFLTISIENITYRASSCLIHHSQVHMRNCWSRLWEENWKIFAVHSSSTSMTVGEICYLEHSWAKKIIPHTFCSTKHHLFHTFTLGNARNPPLLSSKVGIRFSLFSKSWCGSCRV